MFYIGPDPPARPCTANGFHNVTTLEIKGSKEFCEEGSTRFNEVNLRCESPESMQFLQHCDTEGKSGWLSYYKQGFPMIHNSMRCGIILNHIAVFFRFSMCQKP